jgi:hypothetical protein
MHSLKIDSAEAEKLLTSKKFKPVAPTILNYLQAKKAFMEWM